MKKWKEKGGTGRKRKKGANLSAVVNERRLHCKTGGDHSIRAVFRGQNEDSHTQDDVLRQN